MKRRFSLIAVLLVVFSLSIGAFAVQAAGNDKADLTGDWYLMILPPCNNDYLMSLSSGIKGNAVFVLKQDGDKLSGTYKSKVGELLTQGSINRSDFEMTGTVRQMQVTYKGKLEAGKITGKIVGFGGSADFILVKK